VEPRNKYLEPLFWASRPDTLNPHTENFPDLTFYTTWHKAVYTTLDKNIYQVAQKLRPKNFPQTSFELLFIPKGINL